MTAPLTAASFLTHLNELELAAHANAHGDVRKAWEAVNDKRRRGIRPPVSLASLQPDYNPLVSNWRDPDAEARRDYLDSVL
jgi:hypothetical protein